MITPYRPAKIVVATGRTNCRLSIAVLRPGLVAETKVGGAADHVPAPAPTTIDLTNRRPVIGHADVVNVYNGPVTIYQGSAPASDHQSPSMSDNG